MTPSPAKPKPICSFCDRNLHTWQKLAEHLVQQHERSLTNGARYEAETVLPIGQFYFWMHVYKSGGVRTTKVWCWCGHTFWLCPAYAQSTRLCGVNIQLPSFASHLRTYGGMEAHLLQIALGIAEEIRHER